jgi:predicted GNAT family N-acyltransferase
MRVDLFGVADAESMERALSIRRRVLVEEQGVPLEEEADEHDIGDAGAVHALLCDGGRAIGTGRFYPLDSDRVQIGRMAVLAESRRRGGGRLLLDALVLEAGRLGYHRARLLAQVQAMEFYARAGFAPVGDEVKVWDAGILHQTMERAILRPAEPGGVGPESV